jgi:hypothetical protein
MKTWKKRLFFCVMAIITITLTVIACSNSDGDDRDNDDNKNQNIPDPKYYGNWFSTNIGNNTLYTISIAADEYSAKHEYPIGKVVFYRVISNLTWTSFKNDSVYNYYYKDMFDDGYVIKGIITQSDDPNDINKEGVGFISLSPDGQTLVNGAYIGSVFVHFSR